jgi:hypothetical protein
MSYDLLSFLGFISALGLLMIAVWMEERTNDKRPPGSG